MRPQHRMRPDPYPDEMDQEFCDDCETLCMDGRPCMCCWDGVFGSGVRSQYTADRADNKTLCQAEGTERT
jgi:hypothetical protein